MRRSYTYKNSTVGNYTAPTPLIRAQDILYVTREGIGIRIENTFTIGDINADVWRFAVKFEKNNDFNMPGRLFRVSGSAVSNSHTFTLIGVNPTQAGIIYSITILNRVINYTVQPGDSDTDILSGIASLINATVFMTHAVAATIINGKLVIVGDTFFFIKTNTITANNYIFKSGYYGVIRPYSKNPLFGATESFILEINQSNVTMPAFNPLASNYDYSVIEKIDGNFVEYITDDGYSVSVDYFPKIVKIDTATINNAPYFPSNTSSAVFDESNQRIIFSHTAPFQINERIEILYK